MRVPGPGGLAAAASLARADYSDTCSGWLPNEIRHRIEELQLALGAEERRALLAVDLELRNPRHVVLDRVFHRHDIHLAGLELVQRRVQGRGLATAGRTRHQHDPFPVAEQPHQEILPNGWQLEVGDVGPQVVLAEGPNHHLLAPPGHWNARDPQIDRRAKCTRAQPSLVQ